MAADSLDVVDVERLMARLKPRERAWLNAHATRLGGLTPALRDVFLEAFSNEFLYRWKLYEWRICRGLR